MSDCPVRTHLHASCRDQTGSSPSSDHWSYTTASSSHPSPDQIPFHIFEISDLDLFQGLEDPSGYSHSVHVMLCLVGGGGRGPTAACSRGLIWTQPVEFHCLSYSHPCMLAGYMGRKVGAWVGYTTTLRTHQLGEDSRT